MNIHDVWREPVTLLGGFQCRITADEQNEWVRFLFGTPQHAKLFVARRVLDSVVQNAQDIEDIEAAAFLVLTLEAELFGIAEKWFAELQHRRAESPAHGRAPGGF